MTKIATILLTAGICAAFGCGSAPNAPTANNGNANRTVSVTGEGNAPRTATLSSGNNSIEVKQNDSNKTNKVTVTGGGDEKLRVETATDADGAETSEVSDDTTGSVKSTTRDGKKTTVITDGKGVVETQSDGKSKRTVLQDGKNNRVTIGPGGVTLRDRKGNKVVVPR